MKGFKISLAVRMKLLHQHGVTTDEVYESFINRGTAFEDTRADHVTDPPTQWFIADTDKGRALKIVYVEYPEFFAIKSAFDTNEKWTKIYENMCNEHGS